MRARLLQTKLPAKQANSRGPSRETTAKATTSKQNKGDPKKMTPQEKLKRKQQTRTQERKAVLEKNLASRKKSPGDIIRRKRHQETKKKGHQEAKAETAAQ